MRQDPESFEAQYQLAEVDLKLKDDIAAYSTILRMRRGSLIARVR